MAPKGKTGEPERQPAAEFRRHAVVRALRVPTPMQRIPLASCPGAPRPDNVVTCDLFGDLGHRFVVTQWIQIMLVKASAPVGIYAVFRRGLAKVNLDGA